MLKIDNSSPEQFELSEQISIGQFIDVELQNATKDRFKSHIVGCKKNDYLILTQPSVKLYGSVKDKIKDKQELVLRTIFEKTNGDCVAFPSTVISQVNYPDKLIFISYPKKIARKALRAELRKKIKLPARIFQAGNASNKTFFEGVVTNLSTGGCRFECKVDASSKAFTEDELMVEFQLADSNEKKVIHAELCTQRRDANNMYLGCAFTEELSFTHELSFFY